MEIITRDVDELRPLIFNNMVLYPHLNIFLDMVIECLQQWLPRPKEWNSLNIDETIHYDLVVDEPQLNSYLVWTLQPKM